MHLNIKNCEAEVSDVYFYSSLQFLYFKIKVKPLTDYHMSRTSKGFIIGFISGAAIGTVAALLYAPDSGSNTRGKLSYRVSAYGDEINHLIKKLKAEKEKFTSDAKQKSDDVVTDAKKRADDLIKEAEALLDNIEKTKPK